MKDLVGILMFALVAMTSAVQLRSGDSNVMTMTSESSGDSESATISVAGTDYSLPATLCKNAPWVYCYNAIECSGEQTGTNADGESYSYVNCTCYVQPPGSSILPSSTDGAPGITGGVSGEEMCNEMTSGALFSTFANGQQSVDASFVECASPNEQWGWCWGAACTQDEKDPSIAYCTCPLSQSLSGTQYLIIPTQECSENLDFCGSQVFFFDSAPESIVGAQVAAAPNSVCASGN